MEEIFGFEELNQTTNLSFGQTSHVYTADEICLLLAGLGGCVATIVYSVKNIKHSSCCYGVFDCDQRVSLPPSKDSIIHESSV
tara:strand:- start:743 stop:991 length:249 start_codon:yes stop_codon:yes gene_type:complete